MSYSQVILFFSIAYLGINAVPPEACFANFRSDDCGSPPVKVLYYWKPGSRCEVGVWRGCRPNINMFKDEYECVATCIFVARAVPGDYFALSLDEKIENETSIVDTTIGGDENATESTNISPDENATDASGGGTTVSADDGNNSDNNTNSPGTSTAGPESTSTEGS